MHWYTHVYSAYRILDCIWHCTSSRPWAPLNCSSFNLSASTNEGTAIQIVWWACDTWRRRTPTNATANYTDKTRLSCLVGGVNRIGHKSRLFPVVHTVFRDWKSFIIFLSPTILTYCQFWSHRWHGQGKTKQSLSCLVRRQCELKH